MQQVGALHDNQDQVWNQQEERSIVREDGHPLDESRCSIGIVRKVLVYTGVFLVVLDNSLVDVLFEFYGD